MDSRTDMPRRKVVKRGKRGRNIVLTLECGHRKVVGSRAPIPKKAHCLECPLTGEKADA